MSDSISYTLPSGRAITMRLPTVADRERVSRRLLEEYKGEPNAMERTLVERDTLLTADCLLSDSGHKGGGRDPDEKKRFDEWDLADLRAYTVFWRELTSLTDDEEKAAKEAAKSIRARLRGGS